MANNIIPFKPKVDPIAEERIASAKNSKRMADKQPPKTINNPTDYKYLDEKCWWARDSGVSEAGAHVRDYKNTPKDQVEHDKVMSFGPYQIHKKIIGALKNMAKPNLPKSEDMQKAGEKGIHPDQGAFDIGTSNVGIKVREYQKGSGSSKEGKPGVMKWVKGQHNKVVNELKEMPKPNLPKSEDMQKAQPPTKVGISPKALKQQSALLPPVKPAPVPEFKAPTHSAGLEIPKELHGHQGIVPQDHPHREIAAKFVGEVWKKNKLEGQRLSEKYLGVGEDGKAKKTPSAVPYTTVKSEDMSKASNKEKEHKKELKQQFRDEHHDMSGYLKPVNPKDPILNRDIPKKDKKMDVKKAIDLLNEIIPGVKKLEELKKAKELDKTVSVSAIAPSPALNDKPVSTLDKVDPNTKLPGILLNKGCDPKITKSLCGAISAKYGKPMEKAKDDKAPTKEEIAQAKKDVVSGLKHHHKQTTGLDSPSYGERTGHAIEGSYRRSGTRGIAFDATPSEQAKHGQHQTGVHKPAINHPDRPGDSQVGSKIRDNNPSVKAYAKGPIAGRIDAAKRSGPFNEVDYSKGKKTVNDAKQQHKTVLNELKEMPKPNLPKSESDNK